MLYHIYFRTKYRMKMSEETGTWLVKNSHQIMQRLNCTLVAVGVHDNDHIHLLVIVPRTLLIPDVMRRYKATTAMLINRKNNTQGVTFWQKTYLAKTVSERGHLNSVAKYITRDNGIDSPTERLEFLIKCATYKELGEI